jgi:hypothetical protein
LQGGRNDNASGGRWRRKADTPCGVSETDQRPVPVVVDVPEEVPVVPVVPVEPEVPVVPVVPVPLLEPVPHEPEVPEGWPVVVVVGVLPVTPVVGLPRSVMAPLPVVPEELAPEVLSIELVDLQAARPRPSEAATMTVVMVRFIFFSLHIGLRSSSCERTLGAAIGRQRQYV